MNWEIVGFFMIAIGLPWSMIYGFEQLQAWNLRRIRREMDEEKRLRAKMRYDLRDPE